MKQEIPYARYDYAVQPREVDLTKRATIITLGDSILHTAGEDADRIGFGIRNLQSKDSTWVLSRMAVEIDRLPAEYERYTGGTWVGEIGRLMTTRNFIVTDAGGQRIAAASTLWAMMDVKTRQPLDLRDNVDYSRALLAIPCPIDKPAKIGRIEGVPCDSRRVRYSDIDFNQHTNSMKYIQWMLDALPLEKLTGCRMKRLDVNFVHETRYGQQLVVCCERGTDRDRFEIRFEDGTAACKAAIRWETSDERSNQTA